MKLMSKHGGRRLVSALEHAGHRCRLSSKGHLVVYAATGDIAVLPGTPSDYRSERNARAALRRVGINISRGDIS